MTCNSRRRFRTRRAGSTDDAGARRCKRCGRHNSRMLNFCGVYLHLRLRDRASAHKRVAVHDRDDTRIAGIRVIHVGDMVHRVIVVDVHHSRPIDHRGIRDVNRLNVLWRALVCRDVHVARAQREPAHSHTAAKRDGYSKSSSADESHQSGSIHGSHGDRPRDPSPRSVNHSPPAVVKRREAPWLRINPSPSPRSDPNPMPFAVRRPVR